MMRILGVLVVFVTLSAEASAAQVAYSWTGTIHRSLSSATDPWLIGETGKPFALTVLVDQSASDFLSSVENAYFRPTAGTLSVDGVSSDLAFTAAEDFIGFSDDLFGDLDQISVTFVAEFNGFAERMGASVRVPINTFAFQLGYETLPVFGSATTSSQAGFQVGDSLYAGSTGVGFTVTSAIVPEPAAYVLLVIGAVGLAGFRALAKA